MEPVFGLPSSFISTTTVTVTRSASDESAPTFQHCCTATRSASFSPAVIGGPEAAAPVPLASAGAVAPASASAKALLTESWAAGFSVGLAAVIGNPKAILFYMGALPGFFTLGTLTAVDTALIISVSALIPMAGNLVLALFLDRARQLLQSPESVRRLNVFSGVLLIGVALVIPFL